MPFLHVAYSSVYLFHIDFMWYLKEFKLDSPFIHIGAFLKAEELN